MSKDEVEQMKRDAELHADEDKQKREFADAKNEAEDPHPPDREDAQGGRRQDHRGRQGPDQRGDQKVRDAIGKKRPRRGEGGDRRAGAGVAGDGAAHVREGRRAGRPTEPAAPGREEGRPRRRDRRRVRSEEIARRWVVSQFAKLSSFAPRKNALSRSERRQTDTPPMRRG